MKTFIRVFWSMLLLAGLMNNAVAQNSTATIASTLNNKGSVKANTMVPFDVNIVQGNVSNNTTGKIVMQLTGANVAEQAANLQLEYSLNGTDWITVPVSATGEAVINDIAINDKTIAFRAKFSVVGTYNYTLKLLNQANSTVLASTTESVVVNFTEPTINTTLDSYSALVINKDYLFHPVISAGDREDEMVNLEIVLADPTQAQNVQFSRSTNSEGTAFEALTFNENGVIKIGGENGFPLKDAGTVGENLYKAVFSAAGTYNYTFRIVRMDGNVLAKVDESVTVSQTAIGSTLNNKQVITTVPVDFTVEASSASEPGETMVLGRLTLEDPSQASNFNLKLRNSEEVYVDVTFNENGVLTFGPEGGIPLSNFSNIGFRITFNEPGTYNYTFSLIKVNGNEVLASKKETVTVRAFQEATLASTYANPDNILAGDETSFKLKTTKGDYTNKNVMFKFILTDPGKAQNVVIENVDGTDPVRLVFGGNGEAMYMPVNGPVSLADESFDFTAKYASAGTYGYTVQLLDASNSSVVLASTNVSVEVKTATSIKKGFQQGGFAVYPTLTSGAIKVDLLQARNAKVSVIDLMGRTVLTKNNLNGLVEVDLSQIAKGTYIIKIQDGVNINTQRVIVR